MEVSLFLVVDQKTSVSSYTNYYGGRYGAYRRYGYGWGMGYASTTYTENDYLEGTLVMDAFDGESKNQIWQGVAKSTVTENPAKRETSIPKKVGLLMAKFPVAKK
jgi:pectate lyase